MFQQIVQQPQVKGLDFFQEYYDRATDMRLSDKKQNYKTTLLTLFQNRYLRKVELRFTVASTEAKFRRDVNDLLTVYKAILVDHYGFPDFSDNHDQTMTDNGFNKIVRDKIPSEFPRIGSGKNLALYWIESFPKQGIDTSFVDSQVGYLDYARALYKLQTE